MTSTNFLKVIYFDEEFVADFLQLIAGGELKKTTEFLSELQGEAGVEADAEATAGAEKKGLPKLLSVFSGIDMRLRADAGGSISYKRDRIVKNILENTLLSDFVSILKNDEKRSEKNKRCAGIEVFSNTTVRPEKDSFSYAMLIAPYLSMIDGQMPLDGENPMKIDLAKIEGAINEGRGFYEFVGVVNNRKVIFRFNRSSFRNHYTLSDLPKMELTYYGIKVGKISIDELKVSNEFEFGTEPKQRAIYSEDSDSQNTDDEKLDVYDIVLAGVVQS